MSIIEANSTKGPNSKLIEISGSLIGTSLGEYGRQDSAYAHHRCLSFLTQEDAHFQNGHSFPLFSTGVKPRFPQSDGGP